MILCTQICKIPKSESSNLGKNVVIESPKKPPIKEFHFRFFRSWWQFLIASTIITPSNRHLEQTKKKQLLFLSFYILANLWKLVINYIFFAFLSIINLFGFKSKWKISKISGNLKNKLTIWSILNQITNEFNALSYI